MTASILIGFASVLSFVYLSARAWMFSSASPLEIETALDADWRRASMAAAAIRSFV